MYAGNEQYTKYVNCDFRLTWVVVVLRTRPVCSVGGVCSGTKTKKQLR